MSVLIVGSGQQYLTIAAAVAASSDGDTVNVQAGTYTNDFVEVNKPITLNAVGGPVVLDATVAPPDGKAILTEGGAGLTVNINGFTFEGAAVSDGNGAGIRYEGGTLNITNSAFFNNQNGILGAADPNGVITVDRSEFGFNGVGGDGHTHNIYVGQISQFTVTNSYLHDANVGHEVKSRAANNTITGNVIADNDSNASYEIDLPNGGNATITGNVVEQGPNTQNPNIIAIGEEGTSNPTRSIVVADNTIINDFERGPALWNATATTAQFSNNTVYGFGANALTDGAVDESGTTVAGSRPSFTEAVPSGNSPVPPPTPVETTPVVSSPVPSAPVDSAPVTATDPPASSSSSNLVLFISEDEWQGDAQFTVSVDGQQSGGVYTATALHGQGSSQPVDIGPLPAGDHTVSVSFLNDAWGGTADTDRNLYVDGITINGQGTGASASLYAPSTAEFDVSVAPITAATTSSLVLNVSEDAYQGDARFLVAIDGQQYGGVYTAAASHAAGQSEAVTISGISEFAQPHDIAVTFLNDKYDGSTDTDRNLYVDSAQFDGRDVPGSSLTLDAAGTQQFTAVAPSNWTG